MLLTAAVFCMVGGITLLLWISTNWGPYKNPREQWWDENAKVSGHAASFKVMLLINMQLAVAYSVVLVATLGVTMAAQASLSIKIRTDELGESQGHLSGNSNGERC